jgi:CheY-like chemotaxis protein
MTCLPFVLNRPGRVLVASPNPLLREQVLSRLTSSDGRVEHASGGAEALDRLETGFWQTLFLDRHLPDLDTDELTKRSGNVSLRSKW